MPCVTKRKIPSEILTHQVLPAGSPLRIALQETVDCQLGIRKIAVLAQYIQVERGAPRGVSNAREEIQAVLEGVCESDNIFFSVISTKLFSCGGTPLRFLDFR